MATNAKSVDLVRRDAAAAERQSKVDVTRANLLRWFEESLFTAAIRVESIERLLPMDLVRIFDYPGDFVPVIVARNTNEQGGNESEQARSHVIDKPALSLQLANAYVTDLIEETTR